MKMIILAFFLSLILLSCKKDSPLSPKCESLTVAMKSDDVEAAKAAIMKYVNGLPSQEYTRENLEKLNAALSGQCVTTAELLCFSCIYTLPAQSEIKVSIFYQGTLLYKVFDISYTPDNKIKVVNMHD